ncbi:hypothetical protein NDU88_003277 [Pleurodeles waltl]|uniref:Uncharacterized protein n=1 Tax=Pleurodeles waltl TaxID=8319 RepID=A0AAV7NHN5_PLEWA|nr:hypothetical protein NDU88_003277 [Pleurodeles waltl]
MLARRHERKRLTFAHAVPLRMRHPSRIAQRFIYSAEIVTKQDILQEYVGAPERTMFVVYWVMILKVPWVNKVMNKTLRGKVYVAKKGINVLGLLHQAEFNLAIKPGRDKPVVIERESPGPINVASNHVYDWQQKFKKLFCEQLGHYVGKQSVKMRESLYEAAAENKHITEMHITPAE